MFKQESFALLSSCSVVVALGDATQDGSLFKEEFAGSRESHGGTEVFIKQRLLLCCMPQGLHSTAMARTRLSSWQHINTLSLQSRPPLPCSLAFFLSIFICVWADFLVGSDLGNDARTLGVGTEKSWRAPWSTTSMTQVESMVFTWRDRLQVSFVEALMHHLSHSLKGGTQGPYVKESIIRNNVLPGNSIQKHESLLDGF